MKKYFIFIIISIISIYSLYSQNTTNSHDNCIIIYANGSGVVIRQDKQKERVYKNMKIYTGDVIKSYNYSRITLQLNTGITFQIKDEGALTINEAFLSKEKNSSKVNMYFGEIKIKVEKLQKVNELTIETPTVIAGVRGTMFDVKATALETSISVTEGSVSVKAKADLNREEIVPAGYMTTIKKGEPATTPEKIKTGLQEKRKDNNPPAITFISPGLKVSTVTQNILRVQIMIIDENLKKVSINNIPISNIKSGFPIIQQIPLKIGRNTIIVKASDANGNKSEKEIIVIYKPTPPKAPY